MLVITRGIGQKVVIGDDIEVQVLGVKGNQVRLGIKAPKDMIVDREEISQRRKAGIPHPKDNRS